MCIAGASGYIAGLVYRGKHAYYMIVALPLWPLTLTHDE
jgi:hypothetical protein